jgi:hypothetical protein
MKIECKMQNAKYQIRVQTSIVHFALSIFVLAAADEGDDFHAIAGIQNRLAMLPTGH